MAGVVAAVRADGHEVVEPPDYGRAPRAAVHDPGYLAFLENAWIRWRKLPDPTPAVQPYAHPGRHMHGRPSGIEGQAGYYMATGSAPIVEGSWEAATAAAHAATHAARLVLDGEDAAYALCRPPGHHAFSDLAGGFCYLNNIAIAAEYMRRERSRVVDFGDTRMRILSAEDLIVFKLIFDRDKDRRDIEEIYAVQGADLDRGYIRDWLERILDPDDERLAWMRSRTRTPEA